MNNPSPKPSTQNAISLTVVAATLLWFFSCDSSPTRPYKHNSVSDSYYTIPAIIINNNWKDTIAFVADTLSWEQVQRIKQLRDESHKWEIKIDGNIEDYRKMVEDVIYPQVIHHRNDNNVVNMWVVKFTDGVFFRTTPLEIIVDNKMEGYWKNALLSSYQDSNNSKVQITVNLQRIAADWSLYWIDIEKLTKAILVHEVAEGIDLFPNPRRSMMENQLIGEIVWGSVFPEYVLFRQKSLNTEENLRNFVNSGKPLSSSDIYYYVTRYYMIELLNKLESDWKLEEFFAGQYAIQ